jgi:hypothetical protein
MIKRYYLVKPYARENTDLRDYEKVIVQAWKSVNPSLIVRVYSNYYEVIGDISKGDAIRAGRLIAKSTLARHAVKYPINSKTPSTVQLFRAMSAS